MVKKELPPAGNTPGLWTICGNWNPWPVSAMFEAVKDCAPLFCSVTTHATVCPLRMLPKLMAPVVASGPVQGLWTVRVAEFTTVATWMTEMLLIWKLALYEASAVPENCA